MSSAAAGAILSAGVAERARRPGGGRLQAHRRVGAGDPAARLAAAAGWPRKRRRGRRSLRPWRGRRRPPAAGAGAEGGWRCAAGFCTSCSSACRASNAPPSRARRPLAGTPRRGRCRGRCGGAVRRRLPGHRGSALREPFGAGALAEAPVAAVIGDGVVVSGTVDRLFVGDGRVLVADFKTGRTCRRHSTTSPPPISARWRPTRPRFG